MSSLRERPRVAVAMGVALVVLVVVAMLAGGALAGASNNCATAGGGGKHSQTQTVRGTS
jgi:hypothetical protein